MQTIELVLRDKVLSFAEGSRRCYLVSQNDDYVMHIDIDEPRTAMFAVFVRDQEAVECSIDEEGYVLTGNERRVPEWAVANPVIVVGVMADGYSSTTVAYAVHSSIKDAFTTPVIPPDSPLLEELLEAINRMNIGAQEIRQNAITSTQQAALAVQSAEAAAVSEANAVGAAQAAATSEENAAASETAAETARQAAETAEGIATQAAESAASDAASASSSMTAAQTAKTAAETAQGKAETAQGKAETAQGKAETAQTAAETAQAAAETAQGLAQAAKTASETAQAAAEGAATTATDAAETASSAATTATGAATAAQTANTSAQAAKTAAETAQGLAEAAAEEAQELAAELDVEQIHAELAIKADNLFFNTEDNLLYLTSNGEIIGDGVKVITEGGGGGGGSSYEYKMTLTNLLPSRLLTVAENTPVNLQFAYSSVDEDEYDDGDGVGSLIVNDVNKATFSALQGDNTIDISNYITTGTNTVKVKITNSEDNTKTLTYTVTVVALRLTTTFDQMASYSGNVEFSYTPSGVGEKTVHFIMDGVELDTATVTSNNRSQTFTIPEQSHGAHIFEVYATMTVEGLNVRSNTLTIGMMWIDPESLVPIILCPFAVTEARQGETLTIPFMVYDPLTETATVTRQIIDENEDVYATSEISVGRTAQSWSVSDYPAGDTVFKLTCGSVSVEKTVEVEEHSIDIEPITDGLALEFSAQGRSNSEPNPASWSDHGFSATFEGFGWSTADGWLDDASGNTALRFLPEDTMTIPFKPFESDARTSGFTVEAEFATRDVQDYDAIVFSCFADGRGFRIGSQSAELKSEQSSVSMQFREDAHVRVCFVVENRNQNRLVYIYINGIMCGVSQYPLNDDFSQPTPVGLTIGAESCGLDLYRVRIYGKGLTKNEQLDNYIYDRPTLAAKEAAYRRNDVLNVSEEVDVTKIPPTLPYMIFECAELPQYKGDKKTGINVTYVDQAHPENSFTANGVEMDVQGTSSAGYPIKNYKPKFKSGFEMTQSGEHASKFKLRSDSIPVSTFCLKADFASSENANNVELVSFYEQSCPYTTPPQEDDDRVRQGIEGIPIIVFWQDRQGNVSFIGKYNFNNDKSTAEVFGFNADYPNAESWEFRNNTSNRCLFKASDYSDDSWLNDFEGRYPEESTNFTQLKRVTDWVVSTDRDAVDTPEEKAARLAKFASEFETYFVKSATLFYYLFTECFLMIDSRAKNMFLTTYDGTHWLPIPYDFDTAIGINNEGVLSFDYDLEDTDTVGGANVFNGQTSVLWCNVRDAFGSDIKAMYKTLRSGGVFNYAHVKEMFDEHQSVWPEAIWNEDAFVKYLKPYLIDGENYLSMLQGSKESQRDWWLFNAFKYRDSKYQAGDALSTFITLRCYALGDITVTPYSHIWPCIKYGSYTVTQRGKRNTAYTLVNPMDQMNDTEVYIYSADRIKDVGDLSGLQVGYANFAAATKLQTLKLGSGEVGYTNTNLKELYVGNNELLKTVDIRNCTALGTDAQKSVDLSGCASLETVLAQGTALSGITLPNGGHVQELHLPATLTNFTILNQKNLQTLDFEGLTALTTLRIENTPNIDVESIVNDATALNRVRLINVEWTSDSSSDLEAMIDKLKTCIGMDAAGNNTAKAVVTGTVDVPSITLELYDEIRAEFPELNITANGKALYVVKFMNGSDVYDTQIVAHGDDATVPQGTPTKASTAQYEYTFTGWGDYTNITANRNVLAQYSQTVRTYTVTFYNGSTLLETVTDVPYGGTATYTGETPVHPSGRTFLGFQPTGANIKGDTKCMAKFEAVYEYAEITDSWQDILDAIENGTYSSKYNIGNYKPLDLGAFGTLNMQIVAFDEDELSDGSGYAPISFVSENLSANVSYKFNTTRQPSQIDGSYVPGTGSVGGWEYSNMRAMVRERVKPQIPTIVLNRICNVNKYAYSVSTQYSLVSNHKTVDDVWVPSCRELGVLGHRTVETVGPAYTTVYSAEASRIKKVGNSPNPYWTRSASSYSWGTSWMCITGNGYGENKNIDIQYYAPIGFCLGTTSQANGE